MNPSLDVAGFRTFCCAQTAGAASQAVAAAQRDLVLADDAEDGLESLPLACALISNCFDKQSR